MALIGLTPKPSGSLAMGSTREKATESPTTMTVGAPGTRTAATVGAPSPPCGATAPTVAAITSTAAVAIDAGSASAPSRPRSAPRRIGCSTSQ